MLAEARTDDFGPAAAGPKSSNPAEGGYEPPMLRTLAGLRRQTGPDAGLRGGPDGALYSAELFESHVGEVTASFRLARPPAGHGNRLEHEAVMLEDREGGVEVQVAAVLGGRGVEPYRDRSALQGWAPSAR